MNWIDVLKTTSTIRWMLSALLLASAVAAGALTTESFDVYVAPKGDDKNDGRSPRTPLHSLDAVQKLLRQADAAALAGGVNVYFRPGIYSDVSVQWKLSRNNLKVSLLPHPGIGADEVVVFDGSSARSRYFFNFDPAESETPTIGSTMQFSLRNLTIRNYCEGISFGDVNGAFSSGGHEVTQVVLRNIGSKYDKRMRTRDGKSLPSGDCVAGIRLSATHRTSITNSRFENIENLPSEQTYFRKYGPALIHAIYISTNADGNRVVGNTFDGFTGSPVRIRDRSDDIVVSGNSFRRPISVAGLTDNVKLNAVSEWYCNTAVPACMEKAKTGANECPSKNLKVADNQVEGVNLFADESQTKESTCKLGPRR